MFQNYDTVYARFFPTYSCNHSCYTIYVRFFVTYTCVLSCFVGFLFPSIWPFSYKRAYICAQKSPYICVTNKHVVYGVTCNHSCYTIYVRFFVTYTCVLSCFVGFLFPSIWPFSYKRAYICAQKSPYICVTNKHVVYGVTESRRIRGTELYRQQKTPSCTMELKSNFSLNQAWPQWPR